MVNTPINRRAQLQPIVAATQKSVMNTPRLVDVALTASMFTNLSQEPLQLDLSNGSSAPVRAARQAVEANAVDANTIITSAISSDTLPEDTARAAIGQQDKKNQWLSVGQDLYLEQALGLQDPTVDAEVVRFATNMQIGQELLQQRMSSEWEDSSVSSLVGGFVDRYILRATVIGGWEQVFNRNEVKGNEHLAAASTMSPTEFATYMESYITKLGNEGFFSSDNFFAYADGLYEVETAGEDPNELLNRGMGVLDVLPVIGATAKGAQLLRSGTFLGRVGALSGPKAATEAGERLLKASPDAPDPTVLTDMGPSALSPHAPTPIRPSMSRAARIAEENSVVQDIRRLNEKSFLGQSIDGPAVQAATARVTTILKQATNNPIVNLGRPVRMSDTGNFTYAVSLGTVKSGSPYRTEAAATRVADKLKDEFPTATVVPVDATDAVKGYYVNVTEHLDLGKEAPEFSAQSTLNTAQHVYSKLLSSKAATEVTSQQELALLAEGATSTIGKTIRPLLKKLDGLPVKSKDTLSKIYSELRDGSDSFIRDSYTRTEFEQKWKKYSTNPMTTSDFESFAALRDINDASWMMRTHSRLQKYVERGYYALLDSDGVRLAGKPYEGLGRTELVTDLAGKRTIRVGDLRKSTKVWKLDRPLESGNEYIVNPAQVKVLAPEDVLGYNAGGRRINPNANNFVTAGTNRPKAFLATFSEKQAQEVVNAFAEIKKVVDEVGVNPTNTKKLDEVVARTNDWNPEIQTFKDLLEFTKAKGFNITDEINFKKRDGEIKTGEVADEFSESWGEYVTFGMQRSDNMLTEYGGKEAIQQDPISAIFSDFSSTAQHYTHNVITQQGINGWLKAARRKGSGWNVPHHSDPRKAYEGATLVEKGNRAGNELLTQKGILNSRLRIKGSLQQNMESFGLQAREALFDKTGFKAEAGVPQQAANKLLSLGFQSAFGFFNTAQFFVQGFHGAVIAVVAPKQGLKGLAMVPAVRMALMTDDVATETLAVQRLARSMGMEPGEAKELLEYIHTTGRNVVDEMAIENGTATAWGVAGWKGESLMPSALRAARQVGSKAVKGALNVGITPFREGERFARLTGINTAFLEFKAAFPGTSALSEYGIRWIRNREDALTLRMTNANRATIQEGVGKLPTQWMSHTLRVMETMVVGRDLTKGERARLAAMYLPFFGLTGMGAAKATDYFAEKLGAEPAGHAYKFLKYGIIDGLLSYGGIDVAVGQRLAPITLLQDIYRNVEGDATPLEMVMGPSGSIASGFVRQITKATTDLFNGGSISMTNDIVRTLRNFSGVDNVYKAYGIMSNGMYRSRTGIALPFELDTSDAIAQVLGFTAAEVNEWYQEKRWSYNTVTNVRDFSKTMQTDWEQAVEYINNGNEERGLDLMREIEVHIQFSGLSEYDKGIVRNGLQVRGNEDVYRMINNQMKRGDDYRARVLENTFNQGNQ